MNTDDRELRQRVRDGWPQSGSVPEFAALSSNAERAAARRRRRYAGAATAAVIAALAVIALGPRTVVDDTAYVEVAELLETTYWVAPSDVLLPEREFDIYQEVPALFEST